MSQKDDVLREVEDVLSHPALGAAWDAEDYGRPVYSYRATQTSIPALVRACIDIRADLLSKPEQALPGGYATRFRTKINDLRLEVNAYVASLRGDDVPASRLDLFRVQQEIAERAK